MFFFSGKWKRLFLRKAVVCKQNGISENRRTWLVNNGWNFQKVFHPFNFKKTSGFLIRFSFVSFVARIYELPVSQQAKILINTWNKKHKLLLFLLRRNGIREFVSVWPWVIGNKSFLVMRKYFTKRFTRRTCAHTGIPRTFNSIFSDQYLIHF